MTVNLSDVDRSPLQPPLSLTLDFMTHPVNPNLSESQPDSLGKEPRPATAHVRQNALSAESLRDAYTFSKECCIGGQESLAYTVWITVGVQSFCIDGHQDTEEEADWMRLMIGKALYTLLSEQSGGSPADGVAAEKLWTVEDEDKYGKSRLSFGNTFVRLDTQLAQKLRDSHHASLSLPKPETEQALEEVYNWLGHPMTKLGMREYFHRKIGDLLGKERVEYHE